VVLFVHLAGVAGVEVENAVDQVEWFSPELPQEADALEGELGFIYLLHFRRIT
jgi:hypothetical protein